MSALVGLRGEAVPALRMIVAGDDAGLCAASGRSVGVEDFRAKKRGPLQAVPVIARAIADRLE